MTVTPDWTPPGPPEPGKQQIRPGRVWVGIGIAISGHLLTILIGWIAGFFSTAGEPAALNFLFIAGAGQVVLAIAALTAGIIKTVRGRDGGVGVGIIIGWAVGLIISPVIGFGVCVSLVQGGEVFG